MPFYSDPQFAAEPFEEQGNAPKMASAAELQAFYDRDRQQVLERRLSKRKSTSGSIWTRRRSNRQLTNTHPPPPLSPDNKQPPPQAPQLAATPEKVASDAALASEMEQVEENRDQPQPLSPRSVIPDALKELPTWYTKEIYNSVTFYQTNFPMHNPVGPRYYRNVHLTPPTSARPPSFFSPSFPAMTASLQERSTESTRMPTPVRTPSTTPDPTPTSSQTRIADGGKPRSRKTSQTAQDTVDLMDITDPWGTNWHHQSPYDVGLPAAGNVSTDAPENRSRRHSTSTSKDTQRRTVTPSPLSQSTTAVHLQAAPAPAPKRLSKRRAPLFSNVFTSERSVSAGKADAPSLPVSPAASLSKNVSDLPGHVQALQKLNGGGPPSAFKNPEAKKEKRGSVLGRLAKRFSVLRKPTAQPGDESFTSAKVDPLQTQDAPASRQPSPEKSQKRIPPPSAERLPPPSADTVPRPSVDRVPPLSVEAPTSASPVSPMAMTPPQPGPSFSRRERRESDDDSLKLDASFSIGKLMIANPDVESSSDSTPQQANGPLPPVKEKTEPAKAMPPIPTEQEPEKMVPPTPTEPVKSVPPTPPAHNQSPAVPAADPVRRSFSEQVPPNPSHIPPVATVSPALSVSIPSATTYAQSSSPGNTSAVDSPRQIHTQPNSSRASVVSGPYANPSAARSFMKSDASVHKGGHRKRTSADGVVSPSTSAHHTPPPEAPAPVAKSERRRQSRDEERPRVSDRRTSKEEERPRASERRTSKDEERPPEKRTSLDGHSSDRRPLAPAYIASAISRSDQDNNVSRLSTASVLVNPPTPQRSMEPPVPSSPAPPALPPKPSSSDGHGKRRSPSPSVAPVTARQTETFRLVRSPSGNVYTMNGEVIKGGGEHWELVQQPKSRERSTSKSRESEQQRSEERGRERSSDRRERKKRDKTGSSSKHHSADILPPIPPEKPHAPRSTSLDSVTRSQQHPKVEASHRPRPSRRVSQPAKGESSQRQQRPLERNASVSARPTSEVPSADDLNATRAREAWDMERLYKARSMAGIAPNGHEPALFPAGMPMPMPQSQQEPARASNGAGAGGELSRGKSLHGSSHTSFTVQNPFEIPVPFQRSNNPLPEPPRESAYQPAPLSHPLFDVNGARASGRSSEYWTSYGNVSTAHY